MLLIHTFLLVPLLVGALFCLVGMVLYFFPPRKINWFYGYRTPRAMQNQESWDFAQRFSAKVMIRYGLICLALSVFGFLFKNHEDLANGLSLILVLGLVVLLLVRTERELNRKFGDKD